MLIPHEERAVRTWLTAQGFQGGDLRSEVTVGGFRKMTPMAQACFQGELHVCEWLYAHGAAADITKADKWGTPMYFACAQGHLNVCRWLYHAGAAADIVRVAYHFTGETPMLGACKHGHLSICQWLFQMGGNTDVTKPSLFGYTPMYVACAGGHLNVCRWLYQMDADVTEADKAGYTPMHKACEADHLEVCEWLYEAGADADISKASNIGNTPMFTACNEGHLRVCQWLYQTGAAADITRANRFGITPLRHARDLSIWHWLVLEGALNHPASAQDGGRINQALVAQNTVPTYLGDCRPLLLAWAQKVITAHDTFTHVVLKASVLVPYKRNHQQSSGGGERCHLPRLPRGVLGDLASLLGVEVGTRLRNVIEFASALRGLCSNATSCT